MIPRWNDVLADPTYVYCADETKEAVKRFIESLTYRHRIVYSDMSCSTRTRKSLRRRSSRGRIGRIVSFPSYDLQSDRENVDEFVKRGWTIITENNDDLDKVFAPLTEGEER